MNTALVENLDVIQLKMFVFIVLILDVMLSSELEELGEDDFSFLEDLLLLTLGDQ